MNSDVRHFPEAHIRKIRRLIQLVLSVVVRSTLAVLTGWFLGTIAGALAGMLLPQMAVGDQFPFFVVTAFYGTVIGAVVGALWPILLIVKGGPIVVNWVPVNLGETQTPVSKFKH